MIKKLSKGRVRHDLSLGKRAFPAKHVAECQPSRTLLALGQAIFEFESVTKSAPRKSLEIALPRGSLANELKARVAETLQELITFVLLQDVMVQFVSSKDSYQTTANELSRQSQAVSLFSGGVDSISGTLLATQSLPHLDAMFCAHLHQGRVIALTRRLSETYLKRHKVGYYEIPAPSMDAAGYSQTRGFLYVLTAAAVAAALQAKKVIVSECGPTMYQPKFGHADQVTMTTHPYVLARAQVIVDLIAPGITISTPFENLTKAEVMAICPKPRAFTRSHSCISQRLQLHDGTCYGCVVRRLAAIVSGSPDVKYAKDPIIDQSAKAGNLLSLLSFCSEYLSDPDALPSHQRELIDGYNKGDLFRRFALDNFGALYQLTRQRKRLAPAVDRMYRHTIKAIGGISQLKARVHYLQAMRLKPPKIAF